jgi:hypothetical protein
VEVEHPPQPIYGGDGKPPRVAPIIRGVPYDRYIIKLVIHLIYLSLLRWRMMIMHLHNRSAYDKLSIYYYLDLWDIKYRVAIHISRSA